MLFMGRRKVWDLLLKGRLRDLEAYLKKGVEKNRKFYPILIHLLLEIGKHQEALEWAERYSLLERDVYPQYLYFLAFSKCDREGLIKEKKKLYKLLKGGKHKGTRLFLSAVVDLLMGRTESALKGFKEAITEGCVLGHWGMAEIMSARGSKEEAVEDALQSLKEAKSFPPVYLTLGKIHPSFLKRTYYLYKYLRVVPVSSEACYELAMHLIEYTSYPVVGFFVKSKVIDLFKAKALLESPKLENVWLYKLVASHKLMEGKLSEAAKWILIQQQVLYNTLVNLESQLTENTNSLSEELSDMVYALVGLLSGKDLITEEEFHKVYNERRETRLLEKMYQLSQDNNSEANS